MRQPRPRHDRPPTWPLVSLAVTYAVAAGLHGVLAVWAEMWSLGVLAVVLAGVAVAFLVAVRRRRRQHAVDIARDDLVIPIMRRRDPDTSGPRARL
jgi:membrane protein YdbS with pleckstrin-like domain